MKRALLDQRRSAENQIEHYGQMKWPRSFEQNFRVVKWIVGRGLCCRAERQRVRVGLIRGAAVKGCVRSPCVVEGDVAAD